MNQTLTSCIENAEAKALATYGPADVNVVPVSMIKVQPDGSIWLFDFFMNKTVENIQANNAVALTCWSGMTGVQVKATTRYLTNGTEFTEAVAWVATQNPDRVVKGLLELTPTEVHDISPGGGFSAADLQLS